MKKYFSKLFEKARTDAESPNLDISSQNELHGAINSMNNPIIPDNQPDSQSDKPKEQKNIEQQDLIVRSENTIYGLPIFSTQPKKNTEFAPSRIVEMGNIVLDDGSIESRNITIVPTAKYGYPTTTAMEVWIGIQHIWSESEDKESGKIEFSRKFFIENVLGKTWGRNTRKSFDLAIAQLGSTELEFRHVFYDKAKDITHREVKTFHLLMSRHLTEKRKQSDIIQDKCSVTLHPLVVSNLLNKHYTPINLNVLCSLGKADIAKLLYCKLDSHFAYHGSFKISTARFFYENGIEGKEYKTKSGRKRKLESAVKKLIGLPITANGIISDYCFEESADGKDWILIVFCKKSPKKVNSQVESQKLVENQDNTASDARSKTLNTESIVKSGQKKEPPRTPKKADLEHISKSVQIESQKTEKVTIGGGESTELFTKFINLFCELFTNADRNRINKSKDVQSVVKQFIQEHGERSINFLEYAHMVAKQPVHSNLMRANTPNYLFKFSISDENLVDSWHGERARIVNYEKQQQQLEKDKKFNTWLNFEKRYLKEYREYLLSLIPLLSDEEKIKFEEYKKSYHIPITNDSRLANCFESFSEIKLDKLVCFIGWAAEFKTEEYKQVRHCRDTGRENRKVSRLGWD